MNFDPELAQLGRRHQWMLRAAWLLVPCTVLALATADVFYPGPFGGGHHFRTVQIHLDLLGYFTQQGIETWLFSDKMVLGVRMSAVQGVIDLIKLALIVVGVGSLLRLQPRWALGCAIVWYALASLSESWTDHSGYSVAEPPQFGIHQMVPPAPDSIVQPMAPSDAIPTFSSLTKKLGGSAAAVDQIHAEIEERAHQRDLRALRLRAVMAHPEGFSAKQMAALHYTAAQIGYLEDDKAAVERHLSAIPASEFHTTWDSDYRLRVMQEWLVKNGGSLAPGAYRPVTGMPLAFSRVIAALFVTLGGMLLLATILLVHLRRKLARRLERLRAMAADLQIVSTLRSTSTPGGFGRRLVGPVPAPQTNSSSRRS
jgi:hypothetical protein